MAMFNSYVSLPEGSCFSLFIGVDLLPFWEGFKKSPGHLRKPKPAAPLGLVEKAVGGKAPKHIGDFLELFWEESWDKSWEIHGKSTQMRMIMIQFFSIMRTFYEVHRTSSRFIVI